MPTEEYKGWQPWKCPGCSAELQFSEAHGCILQLCFFAIALLALYLFGLRGWQLAVGTILVGFGLAVMLGAPLDRILPRRLELYHPPPWKQDGFATRPPDGHVDSDNPKQQSPSREGMPPTDP